MEYLHHFNQLSMSTQGYFDVSKPYVPSSLSPTTVYSYADCPVQMVCTCTRCELQMQVTKSSPYSWSSSDIPLPTTSSTATSLQSLNQDIEYETQYTSDVHFRGDVTCQTDAVSSVCSDTSYNHWSYAHPETSYLTNSSSASSLSYSEASPVSSTEHHSSLHRRLNLNSHMSGSDGVPSPYTPTSPQDSPQPSSSGCTQYDSCSNYSTPHSTMPSTALGGEEMHAGSPRNGSVLDCSKGEMVVPAYRTHLSKRQPRKDRLCFTLNQIQQLEASFASKKYLSLVERQQLAEELGISQLQVKTWYQNRRTKWKRNGNI